MYNRYLNVRISCIYYGKIDQNIFDEMISTSGYEGPLINVQRSIKYTIFILNVFKLTRSIIF